MPMTMPVFRNGRGSPSSDPPAALIAATVALTSSVTVYVAATVIALLDDAPSVPMFVTALLTIFAIDLVAEPIWRRLAPGEVQHG